MLDNLQALIQAPVLNIQLLLDGVLIGSNFAMAAGVFPARYTRLGGGQMA